MDMLMHDYHSKPHDDHPLYRYVAFLTAWHTGTNEWGWERDYKIPRWFEIRLRRGHHGRDVSVTDG